MESNGIEWNRMESNGIEWNRMESNGINTPAFYTYKKGRSREQRAYHPRLYR